MYPLNPMNRLYIFRRFKKIDEEQRREKKRIVRVYEKGGGRMQNEQCIICNNAQNAPTAI